MGLFGKSKGKIKLTRKKDGTQAVQIDGKYAGTLPSEQTKKGLIKSRGAAAKKQRRTNKDIKDYQNLAAAMTDPDRKFDENGFDAFGYDRQRLDKNGVGFTGRRLGPQGFQSSPSNEEILTDAEIKYKALSEKINLSAQRDSLKGTTPRGLLAAGATLEVVADALSKSTWSEDYTRSVLRGSDEKLIEEVLKNQNLIREFGFPENPALIDKTKLDPFWASRESLIHKFGLPEQEGPVDKIN